ncbi:protein FAR1-RELATED SEQUENCE [Citrus sinensis]|uniref:Protein FAR1-RELATED SEQUENCE n=1 Tax=Citrus sinensis TaxID=2711 RepID=A0ACB8L8R3_CITSI|nr:protein FAR1-RELATED SEQUENCE [Citrus sinensis]
MLFDNHEEIFAFYKAYGKQEGFPVKVRSTKNGTDGIVKYATFTCGRSGKSESKSANALKPKPNVKNGCDAKIGGGYENVSFLEKDCRNFVDKIRRLQLEEGDAMALLKYFQKKQAECNGFFFSIDLDEEDRLKNVFWADSRSRAAYKYFGDVITFDTTYLTNKYDMPFAPFVGVNHHGQSILLECGLISREDAETFTWLFEAWLSCMSDSPPLGMSTTQRSESMNAFFDGFVNSKTNMKQFVKQYENALRRKVELEWQADTKCFSKRTPCVSRYEMERQVEEVYIISKFKEFQEELTALMHALAVLIRNLVELLPERYILSRWGKDVRRCYSKLKVCYGVQNLTIQQERYEKMCNAFSEVANIASNDENSYKTVLDWIEKVMKDLPKQIHCESVGKTNTGGASCSSNKQINSESVERTVIGEVSCSSNNVQLALNDPVVTRCKGRPPCLRKESLIRKKFVQKNKSAQKNKDLQANAPSSYHVPNEISTQGSNIATTLQEGSTIYGNLNQCGTMGYYNVPMYQSQFGGSNIYQPFPYNCHTLHYSSPSITYQGSQSENFQQLLQQQQRNEDNNYDT